MAELITSASNPLLKKARKVLEGHTRAFPDLCFAEGVKVVEEALKAGMALDTILFTDRLKALPEGRALYDQLAAFALPCISITQPLMASLSIVGAHQGIVALVRRPVWTWGPPPGETPWFIGLHGIQDPGNLGTILRTSDAAGVSAVIACIGTVDPFNAKSIRASMGSAFRVPLQTQRSVAQALAFFEESGVRTIAAAGRQGVPYTQVDLTGPLALILGSEGHGLPLEFLQAAEQRVHIPMTDSVDSLNVAVSAAILIYEVRRQRQGAR